MEGALGGVFDFHDKDWSWMNDFIVKLYNEVRR